MCFETRKIVENFNYKYISMATLFHLLAMSISICAAAWSPQYWSSGSQRFGVSATTDDVKYWPPTVAV